MCIINNNIFISQVMEIFVTISAITMRTL